MKLHTIREENRYGNNFAESTGWASVQGSHIEEYYQNWIIDTLQHNDRDFESFKWIEVLLVTPSNELRII